MTSVNPTHATAGAGTRPGAATQLALATIGFGINFWAWALLSPLGKAYYGAEYDLSATQVAVLVAIPVVVGSLGRILVGAYADRLGAKVMFPLVSALTIIPVLFIGLIADPVMHSFLALELGGFVLGLGGTAFAVGVPHVSKWYQPPKRGTALGIFGIGMGGTAIAAFTTVPLFTADEPGSHTWPFILVAVLLAVYALVSRAMLRDPDDVVAPASSGGLWQRTWDTLKMPTTLELAWLYAIGFGGFVAFSVYLPSLLTTDYGLEKGDAALRTAIFVVLAVAARPVGGTLSDKFGGVKISVIAFATATVCAAVLATRPELIPIGTIAFLVIGMALGAASGSTFALVGETAPHDKVGSVTGIVGAVGGLGGFVPPLVMGAVWDANGNYKLGFVLLAALALATLLFTLGPVRKRAQART